MASKKLSKYIGDAGVAKFLEQYKSQTPFYVVRMRVCGALASPNKDLLPVMVVASFWEEDKFPRFVTKDEAETFFSTFMGLWRRMEKMAGAGQKVLSARGKISTIEDAKELLMTRVEEIDAGFIEGFWGGQDDMKMPSATAALIDGLSDEAESYNALYQDISEWSDYSDNMRDALIEEIDERDTVVEDAMKALLLLKEKSQETQH
ncbi:hypothetical protein RYZ26_08125 [Terasakiella sp. A23]|uniref:hypothetical protein n=1 Tax=Terasakiella sp. FCG-A23 TaxID=3080561 RepID=UPI0029543B46|nr:hypothetical protein [Terasakiella sp. A23]MDV7339555.1 hypothetical protein [Terasakiella sp. A23]